HRVRQRANNLGIVTLDVRPNPEDPGRRAVFTSVANYSPEEQKSEIELRFDDQLLETKSLTIPPTNTTPVVFLATQPRDGVFNVRITVQDDLAADNQASIVSLLPQPVRVLLVSRGNKFLEKALKAAGKVDLAVASDVTEVKPNDDIVVLDDVTPAVWPNLNVLAIHSMNTNWFDSAGSVDGPAIVDWKSAHPLLRFVSFDNVQVAKALAIKTPAWAIAVADSPQTPLILAGELDFGKFGSVTATTMRRANLEIWRWIAAIGLAVLMFEWWWYHKRTV